MKASMMMSVKSVMFLIVAVIVFVFASFILIIHFYMAPVLMAKARFIQVRNLTPVVEIPSNADGVLEKVFVSKGQTVQKGELLGVTTKDAINLDIIEIRRGLAGKILELNCLTLLKQNKSNYVLPYDAEILIGQMIDNEAVLRKEKQCQTELVRNLTVDQLLEETIAALEDQSRVLDTITGLRSAIRIEVMEGKYDSNLSDEVFDFPFEGDQKALIKAYRNQYFPMIQLTKTQQELRKKRAEYFTRQLQKSTDLNAVIKQTTQEITYLNKKLHQLNVQLKDTYIYASITGTVVNSDIVKAGEYYRKDQTAFELKPLKNNYLVTISLDEEDAGSFKAGVSTSISFDKGQGKFETIDATTSAVLRRPNGKLEAVLDMEQSTKAMLASGYEGNGQQQFRANITSGKTTTWRALTSIVPNY